VPRGLVVVVVALLAIPAAQASPRAADQSWVWLDPAGTGDAPALLAALGRLEATHHHLDALGIVTFRADAATARALHGLAGGRLERDHAMELHLDESVPAIGADAVKRALGPLPGGPTVLVVDTGIDSSHPDFREGQNLAANVQPARVGGLPVGTLEGNAVVDEAGHGTHVAGVVAGSGASLGDQDELHGRYTGAYSIGRVASYKASSIEEGQEAKVEVTGALEAFEWALDNQERFGLAVVTNSWGERGDFDPDSPISYATKRLYLAGMTVVFSAGNNGEDGTGTLNRYCVAPWVLCVAAADLDGTRQSFSSVGTDDPAKPYDHPDLTAPGLGITSTRPPAQASPLSILQPSSVHPSRGLYADRSGTSIAAPHVAATAALLLAGNPDLSPDQVMETLVSTTRPMAGTLSEVGAGALDASAAFAAGMELAGERAAFLAGDAVRYAGSASGDVANAQDPVSVAVQGQEPGGGLVPPDERLWVATPVGIVLLILALAAIVAGTRSRVV
jgi:serine protease AprX